MLQIHLSDLFLSRMIQFIKGMKTLKQKMQ